MLLTELCTCLSELARGGKLRYDSRLPWSWFWKAIAGASQKVICSLPESNRSQRKFCRPAEQLCIGGQSVRVCTTAHFAIQPSRGASAGNFCVDAAARHARCSGQGEEPGGGRGRRGDGKIVQGHEGRALGPAFHAAPVFWVSTQQNTGSPLGCACKTNYSRCQHGFSLQLA